MPQSLPCQGHGSPSFPSFPGKGRELPLLLPHIPAAEPGDCDELRVRGASGRFLAPAGRPAAIARLLLPAQPCSLPAVPPRLHHGGGHQAVTLARPRSPQPSPVTGSQANRDNGREERGQVGGTDGVGMGMGCHAAGHSPLRAVRCCTWNVRGVPALEVAMGCPDGETQLPLAGACSCQAGWRRAQGWGIWQQGYGVWGCSPPSHSLCRGEAQEEPSGEVRACCAPAAPCFPSYTVQLAGCLHRPELILAAQRFPLLPCTPACLPTGGGI